MMRLKRPLLYLFLLFLLIAIPSLLWLASGHEPALRKEARSAYANREWNQAFNLAARHLRESPDDTEATLIMARAARRLKRDQNADQLYARVGKLNAAEDYFLQADYFQRHNRFPQSEEFLQETLIADPNHLEALKTLTDQLIRTNRQAEALQYAERSSQLQPAKATPRVTLGLLHQALNQPHEAARAFAKALELSPGLEGAPVTPASARKLLARNLLRENRSAEALALLNSAVDQSPKDRESLWLASRAQLQQGHAKEALEYLERAKKAADEGSETGLNEEPAAFTGAQSCRECHEEIHDDQQSSRHALTFHWGDASAQLPWNKCAQADPFLPDHQFQFDPQTHEFAWKAQETAPETRALVKYIMGSGRHAVTPVLQGPGDKPLEGRLTWYAAIHGWDITPGQTPKPKRSQEFMGVPQTPDMMRLCLNCHTTNFQSILAETGPESKDRGIGCERCHGPAGNHITAMKLDFPDKAIGRFRRNATGSRPQAMQMCAECHGTLGREIADKSDAAIVRFQSTTLTFSECYKKNESTGQFDCLTCHSPHRNAEENPAFYDAKCLNCHGEKPKEKTAAATGRRCAVNPRGNCVSCHMPKIDSIQPHAKFTDHSIRKKR